MSNMNGYEIALQPEKPHVCRTLPPYKPDTMQNWEDYTVVICTDCGQQYFFKDDNWWYIRSRLAKWWVYRQGMKAKK